MQGRYIEHQALKAFGGRERISMVTSLKAKSPLIRDETVMVGVRGVSNVNELYSQYTGYRLEMLEERIRAKRKEEQRREQLYQPFNLADTKVFLNEQKEFLESMLEELKEVN